ncbi:MAG: hypothetical protein NC240_11330 [Clostridium sp.]|nr:hypothetical protein [Clostridium sp.]
MASVNKIKELANAREYSLALEIVDSQDLSKSLNPQFLRLCGDIYSHAGRYKDARRVLVMAHRLAPESKRVIFSLLELHLNMGHEELAKKYYDIYLFGSDDSVETKQAKYMYDNAHGEPAEKLVEYLEASYMHSMDYDWSFITYLLLIKLGRKSDAEALSDVYCATYKNSEHSDCIGKIAAGDLEADSLIYTYAKEWVEDNDADESEVREQELKLIEEDELRIHPKEAEITIMFEEVGEGVEELSKRKMKKLIKEHEKQERELEEKERMANEESEASGDEASNSDNKKTGLFKKLFKKSKPADEDLTEEITVEQAGEEGKDKPEETEKTRETAETEKTETAEETVKTEETEKAEAVEEIEETEKVEETAKMEETEKIEEATKVEKTEKTEVSENSEPKSDEASDVEVVADTDSDTKAEAETETATSEIESVSETENNDNEKQTKKYKFNIEEVLLNDEPEQEDDSQPEEGYADDDKSQDDWEQDTLDDGETDMSELHVKEKEARSDLVISVDEENDGFAAEADTIDDLNGEADYNNTSDNTDSEKSETEKFFSKKKMEYVFEAADIIIDEDEDEEADDFSVIEDDEFGSMSVEDDEEIETTAEAEEETEILFEIDVEEEMETVSETDVEEEMEIASETDEEEIETVSEADVEEEIETVSEADVEEEIETVSEADVEEEVETVSETDAEEEIETVSEADVEEEMEIASEADVEEDDFEFDFEFDRKDETEKNESKIEENTAPAEEESAAPAKDESINLNEDADFEFDFEFEEKTEKEVAHTEEAPLQADEQQTFEVEETKSYSEPDIQQEAEQEEFETVYEAEIEPKATETVYEAEARQEVAETVYEAEARQEVAETVYEAEARQEKPETEYEAEIEPTSQKTDLLVDIASKKSNLDFPVFKTDLFPEYHVVEVENNFDEIMEKAQDKLQANLLKEEQMQKEAEALLASLGIDYGSVTPKQQVEKAIHKPDNPINNTASRDALKASLKISSEKREILRKIKEHR